MNKQIQTVTGEARRRDIVTVVDIGTTKIVALVGKKDNKGKIRILGMGKEDTPQHTVKRGVVLNIEQTSEIIQNAVKKAEDESGVKFTDAFVGIAGQHIKSRREAYHKMVKGEEKIVTQEILDTLRNELFNLQLQPGHEIIHIIPQSYKVDNEYGIVNPRGMYANRIEGIYNVIEGETESVKNILACFNRIGITINEMFLEPLASAQAVLTEDEREAGVALVDIGGGTTDLAIYHDKILRHTAVIPFGGNMITADINRECRILMDHAEKLKTHFGSAIREFTKEDEAVIIPGINGREPKEIDRSYLAGIIQARMEEILEFVKFELAKSGVESKLGAGIVVTGGGSQLKDLKQLINFMTGQDVKIASPGQNLSAEDRVINSPVYSTAVGLLMLGFINAHKIQTNEPAKANIDEEETVSENEKTQDTEVVRTNRYDIASEISGFFNRMRNKVNELLTENDSEFKES